MPHSRPIPDLGRRCHELRVVDGDQVWRIMYRIDPDAIVLLEIFSKKTRQTPRYVIQACHRRLRDYDSIQ